MKKIFKKSLGISKVFSATAAVGIMMFSTVPVFADANCVCPKAEHNAECTFGYSEEKKATDKDDSTCVMEPEKVVKEENRNTGQGAIVQLMESPEIEHKDVLFKFNFKDRDGNAVDVVHTEFYVDGRYIEDGVFGHNGLTVNTKNVLEIHTLAQTALIDAYKMSDNETREGYYVRFVKIKPDESDREQYAAVLTDKDGNELSGDWFALNGADLKDGVVELTFFMDKVTKETNTEPVDQSEDSSNDGTSKETGKTNAKDDTGFESGTSGGSAGGGKTVVAADTGDNQYLPMAVYTVLAISAIAGMGVVIGKRKKHDR